MQIERPLPNEKKSKTSGTIPNTKGAAARGSPSSKPSPAEKGDHEVVDEEVAIHDYFTSSNHKRIALYNYLTSLNHKRVAIKTCNK